MIDALLRLSRFPSFDSTEAFLLGSRVLISHFDEKMRTRFGNDKDNKAAKTGNSMVREQEEDTRDFNQGTRKKQALAQDDHDDE